MKETWTLFEMFGKTIFVCPSTMFCVFDCFVFVYDLNFYVSLCCSNSEKAFPFAPDPQRHEVERPRLTHFGGFAHVAHVGEPLMRWMQGEVGRVSCRIGRPSN